MKFKAIICAALLSCSLISCRSQSSAISENSAPIKDWGEDKSLPDPAPLKEQFPEYFEMPVDKGVEVYVWQMSPNSYSCGMLGITDKIRTEQEITELTAKQPLSPAEVKVILKERGVDRESIRVIPVHISFSSYYYEIDDAYTEKVKALFA